MKKNRVCTKCGKRRKMSHEISAAISNETGCQSEPMPMESWIYYLKFKKAYQESKKYFQQMLTKEAK